MKFSGQALAPSSRSGSPASSARTRYPGMRRRRRISVWDNDIEDRGVWSRLTKPLRRRGSDRAASGIQTSAVAMTIQLG